MRSEVMPCTPAQMAQVNTYGSICAPPGRGRGEHPLGGVHQVVEGGGAGHCRTVEIHVLLALVLAHEQQAVVLGVLEPELDVGPPLRRSSSIGIVGRRGGLLQVVVEAAEDLSHTANSSVSLSAKWR